MSSTPTSRMDLAKKSAASENAGGGKLSRRSFLRIAPAMVGIGVLCGAKRSEATASESLERAFLGALLVYPRAIGPYDLMPMWAFVARRNQVLWSSMRASYLRVSEDADDRARSDRMFSDVIRGRAYPTSLCHGKVPPGRLPLLSRNLVQLARHRKPSLPRVEFYDWWLRCALPGCGPRSSHA